MSHGLFQRCNISTKRQRTEEKIIMKAIWYGRKLRERPGLTLV